MLKLVFVESSLETVPRSIINHPAIVKDAKRRKKRPSEIILDDSKHHSAMKNLDRREKRGRPDIIHQCLLLALDSPHKFDVYVHTLNDIIIWINRITRLPRNYNRFIGLMEDLFKRKVIKAGDTKLMEIKEMSLKDVLIDLDVYVMSERGENRDVKFRDCAVCIGAFPHGEFDDKTLKVFEEVDAEFISIGDKPLTALYTTCWVLGRTQ